MIKSSELLNSKLTNVLTFEDSKWNYANSILYEMCSKNPLHIDADIIVGKIWLIGRSYAAAIERRKNKDENDDDDFYYEVVAPKMLSIGETLDERIPLTIVPSNDKKLSLREYDFVSESNGYIETFARN